MNLLRAIVAHTDIFVHTRQGGFSAETSPEFMTGLGQGDVIAAFSQSACSLKACGARADHKNGSIRTLWVHFFRVPAFSPFFSHGWILCAANWHANAVTGVANITSDAFTDVFNSAFFNLIRKKGIGDGRARSADKICHPAFDLAHHRIG